jgi:anti-sigma regulatory factor (Ser/Thr protein kinase)
MITGPPRRRVTMALGNTLAFSVNGGPSAPGSARTELGERFGAKLDPHVVGLAQLLLSELVTNCVLHGVAARPGVWVSVRASLFPNTLRVEVSDGGATFRHQTEIPAADLEAGRGLWLIATMASHWGISDRGPARVWFEISRTQGAAA